MRAAAGVPTFLLTDIEGSTALWERQLGRRIAMLATALARCSRIPLVEPDA